MIRALALVLTLAAATPASAAFNPVDFFRGRTHGEGVLKVIFQAPKKITVDSEGTAEKDGALVLRQIVHEPAKPVRTRYWRLHETDRSRFEGTLTDAAGPVRIDIAGEKIRIRYHGKDHLDFDQLLTPVSAKQINNRMRVKRFGITVAHFDEVIRKLD